MATKPSALDRLPPPAVARGMMHILQETCQTYLKLGWLLTQPLLGPLGLQCLGIFIALAGAQQINSRLPSIDIGLALVGIAVIATLGLWLFCRGFWDYLLYTVSLNKDVAQYLHGEGLNRHHCFLSFQQVQARSQDYTYILLGLMGIWLIPIGCFIGTVVLMQAIPMLAAVIAGGGFILAGFLLLVAGVVSVYLSLVFQVFAFETLDPWLTLKRSFELIEGNFGRTLLLLVIVGLVTNCFIPSLLTGLFTPVVSGLTWPIEGWLQETINGLPINPAASLLIEWIQAHPKEIAIGILQLILGSFLTALLLPLGTIAFTFLYSDLVARRHTLS